MPDEPFILDTSPRAQRVREQMASPEVKQGMRRQQSRITVTIDITTGEMFGSSDAMAAYRRRNPVPPPPPRPKPEPKRLPRIPPDLDLLRALLDYDPETGAFVWNNDPSVYSNCRGKPAGTVDQNRALKICIKRKLYRGAHLAWFLMTGEYPSGNLKYKDGDPHNLAFSNLELPGSRKPRP